MIHKILSIFLVLLFAALSLSCGSLGNFPLIPDSVKNDTLRQGFTIDLDQDIQTFVVEGYTVVFYRKEMRIVITPDDSIKAIKPAKKPTDHQ